MNTTDTGETDGEDSYSEHSIFGRGALATSALLAGFSADVAAVLDAE